jgi:hypothetical protein
VATGEGAGDADGVLVGFRAAEGEEEAVQIAGGELSQHLSDTCADRRGHAGAGVDQLVGLTLDGVDDALVAVADVDAHELRVHVDVALAVGVPEVDAFAAHHGDRIDAGLRGPREDGVAPGQRDDLFRGHGVARFNGLHECSFARESTHARRARKLVTVAVAEKKLGSRGSFDVAGL